jgi:Phosphodiester glycosidase
MPRMRGHNIAHRPSRLSMLVGIAVGVLALIVAACGPASAGNRHTYKLKRGVTLTTITEPKGPYRIRVLTVNAPKKHSATLDVGSASNDYPGVRRPSDIARGYGAIAAVNGDFARDGRPIHPSAEDGALRQTGLTTGDAFSMTANEKRAFAKRPSLRITADSSGPAGNFRVEEWNVGSAGGGTLTGFTTVGGSVSRPGSDVCSARLVPVSSRAGKRHWGPNGDVERKYIVDKQEDPCPFPAPAVGSDRGNVLLAAKRDTANGNTIKALQPGDTVTVSWTTGWPGVVDVLGGDPQLLADRDGNGRPKVVAPKNCGSYFCDRNPRTGVGINHACVVGHDGCKVIMIEVDGRQPGWSVGMDLVQFAHQFQRAGADWAINLDGGGGAVMWVANRGKYCQVRKPKGCLVSRPSDATGERPAVSSLMVLPGADRGESLAPTRSLAAAIAGDTSSATADVASANVASLTDPGSTGGLLDALFRGELGRVPPQSADLRRDVNIYRSSRT